MFNNARTYNQEGSWVYNDAEEMERTFEAAVERYVISSGLLNALNSAAGSSAGGYDSALTPMDDDEPISRPRSKSANRRTVISDDDYSSDEDWSCGFGVIP